MGRKAERFRLPGPFCSIGVLTHSACRKKKVPFNFFFCRNVSLQGTQRRS